MAFPATLFAAQAFGTPLPSTSNEILLMGSVAICAVLARGEVHDLHRHVLERGERPLIEATLAHTGGNKIRAGGKKVERYLLAGEIKKS